MEEFSKIEDQLRAKLADLLKRAREIEDELRSPLDANSSEQAIDLADDEALTGVDEVLRQEIADIRNALLRLENGSYGVCSACGQAIAPERLDALPMAVRCIRCA